MWFRTDLRVTDNRALDAAAFLASARGGGLPVVALFVLSHAEWLEHNMAPVRIEFVLRNLECLRAALLDLGIPLVVVAAESRKAVPGVVADAARRLGAAAVFWNREYEVNEALRDKKVQKLLEDAKIECYQHHDQLIVDPGVVKTKDGSRFPVVFSPFKKAWILVLQKQPHFARVTPPIAKITAPLPAHAADAARQLSVPIPADPLTPVPESVLRYAREHFPPGEAAALERLESFAAKRMERYKDARDTPSVDGTSALSPYLAAGVISARTCLTKALALNGGKYDSGKEGVTTWISELAWREFYKNIMVEYPRVCKYKPFKLETDAVPWSNDERIFQKWCEGKTGYPLVDAGMRQLNQTGWMHNRLRMVTSMFLVKDLGIDWRKGEKYFSQNLIDGDLASNNGGWQWSASTGTDSQPYFRVFNPSLQAERFDPNGTFIRRFVPELASVSSAKSLHDPSKIPAATLAKLGYPKQVVDHKTASQAIVQLFKKAAAASKVVA
ncbi:deoxyribodipyrimidine photo-lyase, partial [Zopfochytrium polystomum]